MKKTVIASAIFVAFSLNAHSQEAQRLTQPRLLSDSKIVEIKQSLANGEQVVPSQNTQSKASRGEKVERMERANSSMAPTSSNSGLVIEDERVLQEKMNQMRQAREQEKYMRGVLTEIGSPTPGNPANTTPLTGFAQDLPLVEVLNQIVPEGWKATAAKNANVKKKVSWNGGKNWVKTLEEVAQNNSLNIVIDWNDKVVRVLSEENLVQINKSKEKVAQIDFASPTPASTMAPAPVMANNNLPPIVSRGPNTVPPSPSNATAPVRPGNPTVAVNDLPRNNAGLRPLNNTLSPEASNSVPTVLPDNYRPVNQNPKGFGSNGNWLVKEGSLKDNLQEWARQGGFKVFYPDTIANYSIDDPFMLLGTLEGENGVIAQLADLFGEGKVKQPLEFELKMGGTQRVLIVRNKTYEQRFFKESNTEIK